MRFFGTFLKQIANAIFLTNLFTGKLSRCLPLPEEAVLRQTIAPYNPIQQGSDFPFLFPI